MSASHYPITSTTSYKFVFVTDSGHTYTAYFDNRSNIFPNEAVDKYAVYFGFTCNPPLVTFDRNYDPKVGATLMLLIANFFKNNRNAILAYMCSDTDGQERHRQILFSKWYNESPLNINYVFLKRKFAAAYCGIIYNRKHVELDMIELSFSDFDPDTKPMVNEPPWCILDMLMKMMIFLLTTYSNSATLQIFSAPAFRHQIRHM